MCGLAGYVTKKGVVLSPENQQKVHSLFTSLLFSMQTRGTDATGIIAVGEEIEVLKDAVPSYTFLKRDAYKEILKKNPRMVIGHTRFGTKGKNLKENAHPFTKGTIIGSHNGVVSNWDDINDKVNVDSEVIFELLNKTTMTEAFSMLDGWFAITWIDTRKKDNLHFVTYKNDAFHMAYVPSLETYFWCSLEMPLLYAIEASLGHIDFLVSTFEENTAYTIDAKLKFTKTKVDFASNTRKKIYLPPTSNFSVETVDKPVVTAKREIVTSLDKIDATELIKTVKQNKFSDLLNMDRQTVKDAIADEKCAACEKKVKEMKGVWFDRKEYLIMCGTCMVGFKNYQQCIFLSQADFEMLNSMITNVK